MQVFHKRRRRAMVALAAAVCAVSVAACGGSSGNSSQSADVTSGKPDLPTGKALPKGPVNLTMWWWGEQEAKGAKGWLQDSIQAYEQKHPNVTIKPVLQTTDGLVPAFQTAAAAGKGPDIQFFWGGIYSMEPGWKGWIRPISDYLPASETQHYLNGKEDTFQGKLMTAPWYVQPSFPLLYRKDVLQKAGVQPPTDWTSLLSACDALDAKGITPISGGLKDGFFAGWLFSMIGGQGVQLSDVLDAVTGQQKFNDPKQAAWWQRLQELRDHKCFNDDINSLQLYQGQQRWSDGKAAMTITAGSDVRKFVTGAGVSKVGLMAMPKWANGPGAGHLGSTSQTLGITKTTRYPQVAADFIRFLHTPDRLDAWFTATGSIPADDRFDGSKIDMPQLKQIYDQVKTFTPYLENFIPSELDSKAIFGQTQLLMGGNADAKKAADATEQLAQRLRLTQRDQTEQFGKWAQTYR
jgi:raffinose/stachyose/melibiose transport system substrate-binding protein